MQCEQTTYKILEKKISNSLYVEFVLQ